MARIKGGRGCLCLGIRSLWDRFNAAGCGRLSARAVDAVWIEREARWTTTAIPLAKGWVSCRRGSSFFNVCVPSRLDSPITTTPNFSIIIRVWSSLHTRAPRVSSLIQITRYASSTLYGHPHDSGDCPFISHIACVPVLDRLNACFSAAHRHFISHSSSTRCVCHGRSSATYYRSLLHDGGTKYLHACNPAGAWLSHLFPLLTRSSLDHPTITHSSMPISHRIHPSHFPLHLGCVENSRHTRRKSRRRP